MRQPDQVLGAPFLTADGEQFGEDPVQVRGGAVVGVLPQCSPADTPEAAAVFSDAMRLLDAPGDTTELAALAVSDETVFWGHTEWADGAPVSSYAPRDPSSPVALPAADRLLVTALLSP